MDFLSIAKIFGEPNSPIKLFRVIFDEKAIPQLDTFYNHWESDNALDSQNRAIRRMVMSTPKSYTQKYRTLAEILNQTDTFLIFNCHIDSFISKYNDTDLSDILYNIMSKICMNLADDSSFSVTLSLLWNNIDKPYAKARLLSWCIIYLIFRQYHIKFQSLYDITNENSYNELYHNIISGDELLRKYNIYKKDITKYSSVITDTFQNCNKAESCNIHAQSSSDDYENSLISGKAAEAIVINKNFIGRTNEISSIEDSLKQYNKIFIHGMGGIGKSELVKAFAFCHREHYNTILFISYEHSLCDTIINEQQISIKGIIRLYDATGKPESNKVYFHRKLEYMKSYMKDDTLLILDNFDTEYDSDLKDFLSGNYSVLITTRNDYTYLGLPILHLVEMDPETEQIKLFCNYYKKSLTPDETKIIFQLLRMLDGHTYAIELIAKLMFAKRISPHKMIEILKNDGITPQLKGNIPLGFQKPSSIYDNIRKLFLVDKLNEKEIYIMCNLTLIPISGFDLEDFAELCGLEDCEVIMQLCNRSWIKHDEINDLISLHPLIADVINNEYDIHIEKCSDFLCHFCDKISDSYNMPYSDKLRYTEIALKIYRRFPPDFTKFKELYRCISRLMMRMEYFEISNNIMAEHLNYSLKTYGEYSKQTAAIYFDMCDCELYNSNYIASIEYIKKAINIIRHIDNASAELAYYLKHEVWCLIDTVDIGSDMTEIFAIAEECSLIMRAHFSYDHPQIASLNTVYAYLYCYNGQFEKSLEYADKAYDVFYKLYGDIHADTIAPLGIKALALSAMHHTEDAISLCLHVIEIQKVFFGEEHLKSLKRFETLAKIYQNGNMLSDAKDCLCYISSVLESKNAVNDDFYHRITTRLNQIILSQI